MHWIFLGLLLVIGYPAVPPVTADSCVEIHQMPALCLQDSGLSSDPNRCKEPTGHRARVTCYGPINSRISLTNSASSTRSASHNGVNRDLPGVANVEHPSPESCGTCHSKQFEQ
ncbi:MAG: hypothetical protein U9R74_02320 [Pseudomonadota bacterium]|nr:hypothetical protein [Pseudomonadota bacterium]